MHWKSLGRMRMSWMATDTGIITRLHASIPFLFRWHSVFTSPFLNFFSFLFVLWVHPPSRCPQLLPVPGHCPLPSLSTIPLYLLSSRCPFISHCALVASSLPISWSHRFSFLLVIPRHGWWGSVCRACSTKTVKRAHKYAHAALLIHWCLSGDTAWEQPRLAMGLQNFNFRYQFYLASVLQGRRDIRIRQWTQIL